MRIASFNVENLFDRAKALNHETWEEGRQTLERFSKLSKLLEREVYTDAVKADILDLMDKLGLKRSDRGRQVILRRNRGSLVTRKRDAARTVVVKAKGRSDWIGWIELITEPVNERAIRNTARVIRDIDVDILGVVEAEDRIALKEFNQEIMPHIDGDPFEEIMLIDGNDQRGIDVGVLTRNGYRVGFMRSHVHDQNDSGRTIFSRDCPEFQITAPDGEEIWVLINHFKSKGHGTQASSNRRRKSQATRVAEIYEELKAEGKDKVVIMGDFNDTPGSDPLSPLLDNTDLKDAAEKTGIFDDGGFPGTFAGATRTTKLDYLLLSPPLFARMTGGGYFRKGAWPGVRPRKWDAYDNIERKLHTASDHHAVWVELD